MFLEGFITGIILLVLIRLIAIVAMMWKINGIDILPHLILLGGLLFLTSCDKQDNIDFYPCKDGSCDSVFYVDSPGSYQDNNGYWHVEYWGPKYFTIAGQLDELYEEYVVNNVPLVEVAYDSNYWVTFDDLSFTVPLYSPFGLSSQYGTRIPVGDLTYSIGDIAKLMEPLNIAGYQITKNTCFDCPYSERLFATYSQYTYKPRQQFYLDNRMKGDTLSVYVKATFNTDLGWSEEMNHELKIIID
jgi:hypothetical protein